MTSDVNPLIQPTAATVFSVLDLTSLGLNDDQQLIERLCQQAVVSLSSGTHAHVAAVCVYPQWVGHAKTLLSAAEASAAVKVATVANFPAGDQTPERVLDEVEGALAAGADEIDLVLPYRAIMNGQWWRATELVQQVHRVCDGALLKVIIESGELDDPVLIRMASQIALDQGADFLKTSTGKVEINATPQAARIMLNTIRDNHSRAGFKAAGGIRTPQQARVYARLVTEILGADALVPQRFRIGASSLRHALVAEMEGQGLLVQTEPSAAERATAGTQSTLEY